MILPMPWKTPFMAWRCHNSLEKIKEVVPKTAIHTNDLEAFALTFPEQKTSKNGLHKLYKEHVEQLRLFKEERAKYYAMAK